MKKRSVLSIILCLLICLGLFAGCGSKAPSEPATQPDSGAQAPKEDAPAAAVKNYGPGVTDTTIKIGNTGPQSGPVASLGCIARSLNAYIHYVNDNGGVNGRQLEFIYYDDQYAPDQCVANVKQLVEVDEVFVMCGNLGTGCVNATKDYLNDVGIPNICIATGASVFTSPAIDNLFVAALNYQIEGRAMAQFALDTLNAEKIGVFYQNDDFGKDYLLAIEEYLKTQGKEVTVACSYNTSDPEFVTQAMQMKEAGVDTILMAAMKNQAASFVTELDKLGYREGINIFANNSAGDEAAVMVNLCGDLWEGVYVTSYLPDMDESNPAISTFIKYIQEYCPNDIESLSTALSGWQYGEMLVKALENCGDELTWENFYKQMYSFNDFNGDYVYHVTYTPEDHRGTRTLYYAQVQDGKNVRISDWIVIED